MSNPAPILLVGLGGAGCSIVGRLASALPAEVKVALIDTDTTALQNLENAEVIQIGRALTRGMGTGGEPAVGLTALEADEPQLRRMLTGHPLVVLVAGLGGGTASGAAASFTAMATESGATVLAFATIPFSHEGERRKRQASDALSKLAASAHGLVVVENDLLLIQVPADAPLSASFAAADEWVAGSIRALASTFMPGALVPVDSASVRSILSQVGSPTLFTCGRGEGVNAAKMAAKAACESSLSYGLGTTAKVGSLFVHVAGGEKLSATDAFEVVNMVRAKFGGEVTTLVGARIKPELGDSVEVAVLGASLPPPPKPKPKGKASKGAKVVDEQQQLFVFATEEAIRRGLFGSTPFTFIDGMDVDVPTYIRKSIRLATAP